MREEGAVERGQQGDRHRRADLLRVLEMTEHLHEADQRADQAHGRRDVGGAAQDGDRRCLPLGHGLDLALERLLDHPGLGAVQQHQQPAVQNAVTGERRHPLLELWQARLANGPGELERIVGNRAQRRRRARRQGLRHDLRAAREILERKARERDGEGAAEHDQQRRHIDEPGRCRTAGDGEADDGEGGEQTDSTRRIQPIEEAAELTAAHARKPARRGGLCRPLFWPPGWPRCRRSRAARAINGRS